jgi:hypothetical protein
MVRAMVHMWGKPTALGPRLEADDCIGRSLTLYRDPEVKYGGLKVGGIRISHASHLSAANEMALTIAKGRKGAYTVRPLVQPKSAPAASTATKRPSVSEWFTALQAALDAADSEDAVHAIRAREDVQNAFGKLTGDVLARLNAMMKAALDRFATPTDPAAVDEEAEF